MWVDAFVSDFFYFNIFFFVSWVKNQKIRRHIFLIAAIVGSITLIPGFISYPIAAALIKNGVSYFMAAVFMTTLMMVGVVTLPLEIKYFGKK